MSITYVDENKNRTLITYNSTSTFLVIHSCLTFSDPPWYWGREVWLILSVGKILNAKMTNVTQMRKKGLNEGKPLIPNQSTLSARTLSTITYMVVTNYIKLNRIHMLTVFMMLLIPYTNLPPHIFSLFLSSVDKTLGLVWGVVSDFSLHESFNNGAAFTSVAKVFSPVSNVTFNCVGYRHFASISFLLGCLTDSWTRPYFLCRSGKL